MSSDSRQVAFDPRAPADERIDAQAELTRERMPLSSELIPNADIERVMAYIRAAEEENALLKGNLITLPGQGQKGGHGMRSVRLDQTQVYAQGDYYERPSGMSFESMRAMVKQTPILSAVVRTRQRQVMRFCQPSEDKGLGFEIRHVERDHKLSAAERDEINLLTRFVANCGWEFDPRKRKRLRRDSFSQFMAKLVRDSLTMDAAPIETEMKRNARLGIDGLYALDGASIRLCMEEGFEGDDEIFALQVVQGRITTSYTHDQLIYEVRNPSTDITRGGYGCGECEDLVRTVTGFLNAMTHNIKGFDDNSIPRGLLTLVGTYSDEDLIAFKRYWNAQVKGINNAWTLPVMVSKEKEAKAEFQNFGIEFNEMYFAKWMTFLSSLICAIYGIAPDEINFESFSAQRSSLAGSDTEEKLSSSKDKGLRPLLSHFEALFTDFVVSSFDDRYCFRWSGLDEVDEKLQDERRVRVLTVNEDRAEQGRPPHPDPVLGDAPLYTPLIGPWLQLHQMATQGQDFGGAAPDEGDFGEEPPEGEQDPAGAPPGGGGGAPPAAAAGGNDQPPAAAAPGFGGPEGGDFGKALTASALIYAVEP